jgi:hypothetical protein
MELLAGLLNESDRILEVAEPAREFDIAANPHS